MMKIFIYGPPGSGKSTIGKILAESLDAKFLDVDTEITTKANLSISEIISEQGELTFRNMETNVISQLCSLSSEKYKGFDKFVIALGGGALLRLENRLLVERSGEVVFLDVELHLLLLQLREDKDQRPLLDGNIDSKLANLMETRKTHYDSFKMRVVNILSQNTKPLKTPKEISWDIQKKLGLFTVHGMGNNYDVIVEPKGINSIGQRLKEQKYFGPLALVCDENVVKLYGQKVLELLENDGFSTRLIILPSGEKNKTLHSVEYLWREFLLAGLDRKSTVISLGGGVVGDLVGFATSTFMRGCSWVAVPTTLLSMVDASLGGKTGFDLPEGKNLIGSFHPPRFVLADPEVLSTLPEEEFRSGLAEVVKHGIISDPELFEMCSLGFTSIKNEISEIVRRAIGVKVRIIEQDPFESGLRASLNFGHTIGHAVETVSNYQLRHGEAVSIGMVVETRLAERLGIVCESDGLANKISKVLIQLGLPTEIPVNLDLQKIKQAMKIDKKKIRNVINFALPENIGCIRVGVSVSDMDTVL